MRPSSTRRTIGAIRNAETPPSLTTRVDHQQFRSHVVQIEFSRIPASFVRSFRRSHRGRFTGEAGRRDSREGHGLRRDSQPLFFRRLKVGGGVAIKVRWGG